MQLGLHRSHAETIEWSCAAGKEEGRTRYSLARELCEREAWFDGLSRPCLGSARELLPRLARALGLSLPAAHTVFERAAVVRNLIN